METSNAPGWQQVNQLMLQCQDLEARAIEVRAELREMHLRLKAMEQESTAAEKQSVEAWNGLYAALEARAAADGTVMYSHFGDLFAAQKAAAMSGDEGKLNPVGPEDAVRARMVGRS